MEQQQRPAELRLLTDRGEPLKYEYYVDGELKATSRINYGDWRRTLKYLRTIAPGETVTWRTTLAILGYGTNVFGNLDRFRKLFPEMIAEFHGDHSFTMKYRITSRQIGG